MYVCVWSVVCVCVCVCVCLCVCVCVCRWVCCHFEVSFTTTDRLGRGSSDVHTQAHTLFHTMLGAALGPLVRSFSGHSDRVVKAAFVGPSTHQILTCARLTAQARACVACGVWCVVDCLRTSRCPLHAMSSHTHHSLTHKHTHTYLTRACVSVALPCSDRCVKLWNARDGTVLRTFKGFTSTVSDAVVTSRGDVLVAVADVVRVFNFHTAQLLSTFDCKRIYLAVRIALSLSTLSLFPLFSPSVRLNHLFSR